MNAPIPSWLVTALKWVIPIAVITSMGLCIGSDLYRVHGPRAPVKLVKIYGYWDSQLRDKSMPGRGVFLKFEGYSRGDLTEAYAQSIYYRGVYAMYPLPVLVTEPNVVVNEGKDFLQDNSYPSDQWLVDHGVGSVLTIGFDERAGLPFTMAVQWLGNSPGN